MPTGPNVYPAMHYADADAAITWLEKAFGFEAIAVHRDDEESVAHAELRLGNGIVMLGTAHINDFGLILPADAGGVTQTNYVAVDDVDAHHDRAFNAGAEILKPVEDTPYGSREYMARDPEGHVWSFGSYAPK